MANDREVLHEVWAGHLPVCFSLAKEEIIVNSPEPIFVRIYFSYKLESSLKMCLLISFVFLSVNSCLIKNAMYPLCNGILLSFHFSCLTYNVVMHNYCMIVGTIEIMLYDTNPVV